MSTMKERFAERAFDAAAAIENVDIERDLAPQINLASFYERGLELWKESSGLLASTVRGNMRIALLKVKAVHQAVHDNVILSSQDAESIREAARVFRAIGSGLLEDVHRASPVKSGPVVEGVSPRGLRLKSLTELTDARPFVLLEPSKKVDVATAVDEGLERDIQHLRYLTDTFKAKVPKALPAGRDFAVFKFPIIVTTNMPITSSNQLDRTGVKWMQIRASSALRASERHVMHSKLSGESSNVILFEDQVVVAMDPEAIEDRRIAKARRIGNKNRIVRSGDASNIERGAAWRATEMVNKKIGPHTNGMDSAEHKYFRSPGSHLTFMWLASNSVISAIKGFRIRDVEFPWMSKESNEMRQSRVDDDLRRLHKLREQVDVLRKRKINVPPEILAEIEEIEERTSSEMARPTPEQKADRLEQLKVKLDQELRSKHGPLLDQIEIRKAAMRQVDLSTRSVLQREIKKLEKQLGMYRELIAVRLRRSM